MMAKMFYTLDETKAALNKDEEEIKQYAREGRLREFRDGPRLMFKADQVEALKQELGIGGGTGMSDLGPSDSGGPIGLVDSRTASATGISLVDSDMSGRSGSSPGMQLKDDTALAADLGLSGSVGGVPSPGRPGSGSGSLAGSRGGSGINVLGDTASGADPMAQTAISGGGVTDQVNLEGVGSGSGLLDLTRESDDTSLGAELLDEIAPGGSSKRGTKVGTGAVGGTAAGGTAAGGTAAGIPIARPGRMAGTPLYLEAYDPLAPALGGAAMGAVVMVVFAGFALISAVLGTKPALLDRVSGMTFVILLGVGLGVSIVGAVIGMIGGRIGR
jgi:hypothetical protein